MKVLYSIDKLEGKWESDIVSIDIRKRTSTQYANRQTPNHVWAELATAICQERSKELFTLGINSPQKCTITFFDKAGKKVIKEVRCVYKVEPTLSCLVLDGD